MLIYRIVSYSIYREAKTDTHCGERSRVNAINYLAGPVAVRYWTWSLIDGRRATTPNDVTLLSTTFHVDHRADTRRQKASVEEHRLVFNAFQCSRRRQTFPPVPPPVLILAHSRHYIWKHDVVDKTGST